MSEKRPKEDHQPDYASGIPPIGHTGDRYPLGADGEDPTAADDPSFLRELEELEERRRQAELGEAG